MKKRLHYLTILSFLFFGKIVYAQEGINEPFMVVGDWSVNDNPNGTSNISGGLLDVTMGDQGTSGKYRADLNFLAGTNYTINKEADKLIAIKFIGDKPSTGVLKLELYNLTAGAWINRGGGRYTPAGSVVTTSGDNIYYFDVTPDTNYTTGDIEVNKINFTIADATVPTNYTVDWVASFTTVADIEAYKDTDDDASMSLKGGLLNSVFKVYPNPSTENIFNISLNNKYSKSEAVVKVYNVIGSLVLNKNAKIVNKTISVNHHLLPGVYFVQIEGNTSKLIVK
ncbi:T9SS type A sorting domain-containing protein [Wenyingzhuangia sp. IMCC45467]